MAPSDLSGCPGPERAPGPWPRDVEAQRERLATVAGADGVDVEVPLADPSGNRREEAVMPQELDRKRVQDFARKLFGFYTSGMLTLMVELGYRSGLFEAAARGPATSAELAERAGLDERYVREWLAGMTAGGVFEYAAAARHFTLPAEHAQCLTGPSSRNLAPNSQTLRMLAGRLPEVADCFRTGGGVPYSAFQPDFTESQDASWRRLYDGLLIKGFLPLVPGLVTRLQSGIRVADVGCGTGHAINLMAREYPRSTFSGYDIGEAAIERARTEAGEMGLANARFERVDVAALGAVNK